MPAYNCEKYVKESIDSILNQTHQNFELLISDDSSNDNTKTVIDSYSDPRIRRYHNQINLGYQDTCNKLFEKCNGDYITFQDADDISELNRLELQINAFENDKELGMCGTKAKIISHDGQFIYYDNRELSYDSIKKHIVMSNQFCGATIMIKKEVYNKIGGYRDFFREYAFQDYDWSWLIVDNYKSINLDKALYSYRQQPNSNSKKIKLERIISSDLVKYLGEQRANSLDNSDDIINNNLQNLNTFIDELKRPYILDSSRLYRNYALIFNAQRLTSKAIYTSLKAIIEAPLLLINYQTFLFCFIRGGAYKLKMVK